MKKNERRVTYIEIDEYEIGHEAIESDCDSDMSNEIWLIEAYTHEFSRHERWARVSPHQSVGWRAAIVPDQR